jgi:hypothetical protein
VGGSAPKEWGQEGISDVVDAHALNQIMEGEKRGGLFD